MSNQFIDIEAFARLSGLSVNTIRRKIKTLSETDKNAYIRHVPVIGRGGQKIMLDKALINLWVINGDTMSNQETAQNPVDESMSNQEKETIQEQIKEPEDDKNQNRSSVNESTAIIELLKKQIEDKNREIEYLKKESDIKNGQIAYFVNEVSYLKTTLQLSAPKDDTPADVSPRRWWHLFWK